MDMSAKFVGYVLAAYAVAFILLAVLIGSIFARMRLVRKRLAGLEGEAAARRAAPVRPVAARAEMVSTEQGQEVS